MASLDESRSGKEHAKPAWDRMGKDPMVLLELEKGWRPGSDVVRLGMLLPLPPFLPTCQPADQEPSLAALPAGRAFAAASEMRSPCWLK